MRITGAPQWSSATGLDVYSSPAVANGVVYVGSNDNKLYAFYANNGTKKWDYTTNGDVYSSPAVANGHVYVATTANNGIVYSFGTGEAPHYTSINRKCKPDHRNNRCSN